MAAGQIPNLTTIGFDSLVPRRVQSAYWFNLRSAPRIREGVSSTGRPMIRGCGEAKHRGDYVSGRRLPLHGRGHWFESSIAHSSPLAQQEERTLDMGEVAGSIPVGTTDSTRSLRVGYRDESLGVTGFDLNGASCLDTAV